MGLLAAAALYEATEYRAQHVDHGYVSRYLPAEAVSVSIPLSTQPETLYRPALSVPGHEQ